LVFTNLFLEISLSPEHPQNGQDVTISVKVTNLVDSDISINITTVLHACYYTGKKANLISTDSQMLQDIGGSSCKKFFV